MHHAQTALHILNFVGAVHRVGKKGNSYIYARSSDEHHVYSGNEVMVTGIESAEEKELITQKIKKTNKR
jgi:Fe2+ or Zn2+ uptake regulation protein